MKKLINLKNLSYESKVGINISATQGIYWFAWAFSSYATIYLQQLGFSASDVGLVNASCSAVVIFSMMFFGMLSDKINSVKKVLLLTVIIGASLYTCIPLIPTNLIFSTMLLSFVYPFINIFRGVTPTLLDNLAIRSTAELKLNYGVMRSFGSFFFTLGCWTSVWCSLTFGIESTFWLYGLFTLPALLLIFKSHDPKVQTTSKTQKVSLKPLLKNYYFMTFLVVMVFTQFAITSDNSFFPYLMESVGVSSEHYPTVLAARALMEIPCLVFMIKIRRNFKLKYIVMAGILFMGLQGLIISLFAKDLTSIVLCGSIYGFGNGMFLGSFGFYLFKLAPDNLKASAQSMYATVTAIAGIGGNFIGGKIFDLVGGRTFYIITSSMFFFSIVVFAVTLFLKRKNHNPADEVEN